jgi:hypothetical protein
MTAAQLLLPLSNDHWIPIKDADAWGRWFYERHYSCYKKYNGVRNVCFVGPGEKMVLCTPKRDALFVWRKSLRYDGQQGVNCAVFRNESPILSSQLIRDAVARARNRWGNERLFTFVNPSQVKSSNAGYCFKMAGWHKCGMTDKGLIILEVLP